jgi:ABC-2 type transport system permease protein
MGRIGVILQKEWRELRQQRWLLVGLAALPLVFSVLPVAIVYTMMRFPETGGNSDLPPGALVNPALQGLSELELGQAIIGQQFSVLFLLLPLMIPSILASYSIVGEKTGRTLEPLLATPLRTWELLLAKSLAVLIPAVVLTWIAGGIFIGGMAAVAASARVFAAIVSPGWLVVFLLCSPLAALITIAATVAISARVNDPRSAQQIAGLLVLPVIGLVFGQLFGVLVLNPPVALGIALVLGLVAVLMIWLAAGLFQREVILTRWR